MSSAQKLPVVFEASDYTATLSVVIAGTSTPFAIPGTIQVDFYRFAETAPFISSTLANGRLASVNASGGQIVFDIPAADLANIGPALGTVTVRRIDIPQVLFSYNARFADANEALTADFSTNSMIRMGGLEVAISPPLTMLPIWDGDKGDVVVSGAGTAWKVKGLQGAHSIEDYYLSTDLGDFSPAVGRAMSAGVKSISFGDDVYNFDNPVAIDRDNVTLLSRAVHGATLNLRGANTILLDVGNAATAVRYNFFMDGFNLTKQNVAASGAAVRLRNIGLFGFSRNRFFMDNKFYRGIEAYACIYGHYDRNETSYPVAEHVKISGGSAFAGSLDSWSVENKFFSHIATGGWATAATPSEVGQLLLDDHVAATLVEGWYSHSHKGYGVYGKGTLANIARNTLNIFKNLNVEATNTDAGTLRLDNYQGNFLENQWGEGNTIPAIHLGTNSSANTIKAGEIGVKGATSAIYDNGTNNRIWDWSVSKYTGSPVAGIHFGANVSSPSVRNGSVVNMASVFKNDSGTASNILIDGVEYIGITGTKFDGLTAASSHVIKNVIERSAVYTIASATTITVPPGKENYQVTGTTAIDNITASYMGHKIVLHLSASGGNIRDINISGGNIVLTSAGSTFTSTGREHITLIWQGDYWWQIT